MTTLSQNQPQDTHEKVSIWLPIYIGDMLSMTTRLTTEQIGGLTLLMMDFWKNGDIPNDNKIISAITRLSVAKVKQLKTAIIDCGIFSISDDKKSLYSPYLLDQKNTAKDNQNKKQERAKKAADSRWGKKKNEQNQADTVDNTAGNGLTDGQNTHTISNAQAQNKNATSNAQAMLDECPSSSPSSINNIYTHITPTQVTNDGVVINDTAQAIREQRATELQDWTPPPLDEMKGLLFLAGTNADSLTQNRYQTVIGDFKAYYTEQARFGKPLNSDDIRIAKLRQWLEKDLQNTAKQAHQPKKTTKTTLPTTSSVNQQWQQSHSSQFDSNGNLIPTKQGVSQW